MNSNRDGPWIVAEASVGEVRILAADAGDLSGFVDVNLRTADGRRFTGVVGTLADVDEAMTRWKGTGECLAGRYFWVANLVLVDTADVATIVAAIDDLAATGELPSALAEIDENDDLG